MSTREICFFCGSDADTGNHDYCKQQLAVMRNDMQHIEAWAVMQRAENGYYGKAPHRAEVDPTDWIPRAEQLRAQGLKWRVVADTLNAEGFRSKHGHLLDAALINNNLLQHRKRRA